MVFDKIAEMLAEHLEIDKSAIKPDSTFEGLELDSLDTVELVMTLEDEFGVSIEMDPSIKKVSDLVLLVEEQIK